MDNKKDKLIGFDEASQISAKKEKESFEVTVSKVQELEGKLDEFKDKIDSKIDSKAINIIEMLGIFVALFTFISINFTILKDNALTIQQLCGFILVLLGSLLFFILTMDLVLRQHNIFQKDRSTQNIISKFVEQVQGKVIRGDEIFCITKPCTWGVGFKLYVTFLLLAISFIITGIILII